jgi:hypothetical protein
MTPGPGERLEEAGGANSRIPKASRHSISSRDSWHGKIHENDQHMCSNLHAAAAGAWDSCDMAVIHRLIPVAMPSSFPVIGWAQ